MADLSSVSHPAAPCAGALGMPLATLSAYSAEALSSTALRTAAMFLAVASSSAPMRVPAISAGSPASTTALCAVASLSPLSASSALLVRDWMASSCSALSLASSSICALRRAFAWSSLSALTSASCLARTSPMRLEIISSSALCWSSVKVTCCGRSCACAWSGSAAWPCPGS